MKVLKRNGSYEDLNLEKINKSVQWACKDIPNVSASDIIMNANIHFYDGISTSQIHDIMIKTASEMASPKDIEYDKVAANLFMQKIYHEAFADTTPLDLIGMVNINTAKGYYTDNLLYDFKPSEIIELSNYMDYSRNFNFSYAGIVYLYEKYMIHDTNGKTIEDPQTMFMTIAMDTFRDYHKDRLYYIKLLYDALSTFKISLPTPEMKALRTDSTDYASCEVIRMGDSIKSWKAAMAEIIEGTVRSKGIGIDIADVASVGDKVKNGTIAHGGKLPILKGIDALIQMSQQNGRRGSAVPQVAFFDPEIMDILVLKSPRTIVTKRINDLKYGIKFNKYFYDLVKSDGIVYFYSPRKLPELYDAFYSSDVNKFIQIYESNTDKASDSIPARKLIERFIIERVENGIYYAVNIDHMNDSPFEEQITQTNICCEIALPTKPIGDNPDKDGVGICILANINQANVTIDELPIYTDLLVRMQSHLALRQDHGNEEANNFVANYRSVGIGFSNHAYWLAKHNWKYGDPEALSALESWVKEFQYGLLRASCDLAVELGPAPAFSKSTHKYGYHLQNIDEIDDKWAKLDDDIAKYGLYNIALSAIPPSETSSVIANQTSGLEPIRNLATYKSSKTGQVEQFAPECKTIGHQYDFAFESIDITRRYFKHIAIIQKWIDQSISTNTFYNPELYPNKKIPLQQLIDDMIYAHKLGIKTLYYNNIFIKDKSHTQSPTACSGGGCEV